MAKIEIGDQILFVPDEIASNPNATQAEINQASIPWAKHEEDVMNAKIGGGLAIANNAFMACVDELCVQLGLNLKEQQSDAFFTKYDTIFKDLYLAGLLSPEIVEINKDVLEEVYSDEA